MLLLNSRFLLWLDESMYLSNAAKQMAYALVPPTYPGSQLINTRHYYGSANAYSERFTYRTSDEITVVLAFIEKHMPGFVAEEIPTIGDGYSNSVYDMSDLAKRAADKACTSLFCTTYNAKTYPSVSVTLYRDPDNPIGTIIDVWVSYPTLP